MKINDIDSYKLIHAVSKRPALYDKEHKMYYCHNKFKQRLWKETCEEVYPNWEAMSSHKRVEHGRELQKRWKNLRTCFTREVAFQKKEHSDRKAGIEVRPRKRYEYYNRMLFLLNRDQKEQMEVIQNEQNEVIGDTLENMKTEYIREEFDADENIMVIEPEQQYEAAVIDEDNNDTNEYRLEVAEDNDGDDDKYFLLSLLKTFRQFNDKQKFQAKIEILQSLRRIRFPNE